MKQHHGEDPTTVWHSGPGTPVVRAVQNTSGQYRIMVDIDGNYTGEALAQEMAEAWARKFQRAGLNVRVTVGTLLEREAGYVEADENRKEWEHWLLKLLEEEGGKLEVSTIRKAAVEAGLTFKTIQNGRSKITNPRVTTSNIGNGKDKKHFWKIENLPEASKQHWQTWKNERVAVPKAEASSRMDPYP